MNKRGHVLIHVLITTIIVVVIATGLAQMLLMRFTASNRAASGVAGRRQDEGSFNAVIATWNANNAVCTNGPVANLPANLSCSGCATYAAGNPGACGCSVTPVGCNCSSLPSGSTNPGYCLNRVTTTSVGGRCQLQVKSCE
jgi:Tfp pilus assembly protein PilV